MPTGGYGDLQGPAVVAGSGLDVESSQNQAVRLEAQGNQADVDQLRQRVTAYFKATHARRFSQAREFILPRSRDDFDPLRGQSKARISNFRIVGVEPEPGDHSAVVD